MEIVCAGHTIQYSMKQRMQYRNLVCSIALRIEHIIYSVVNNIDVALSI